MVGYSMLGQLYLMQRKLDAAKAEFDKRASVNPKDVPARLMVGMILEVQKKKPEAKKKYEEVLAIDAFGRCREQPRLPVRRSERESRPRPESSPRRPSSRRPTTRTCRTRSGGSTTRSSCRIWPFRAFEQSIAKDPDNPIFHYHLGLALAKQGDLPRARRSFEAALKLRPDYATRSGR